jgi:hypothetical protein
LLIKFKDGFRHLKYLSDSDFAIPATVITFPFPFQTKVPFTKKDEDWTCYNCNNINFYFRQMCNRCKAPKPADVPRNSDDLPEGRPGQPPVQPGVRQPNVGGLGFNISRQISPKMPSFQGTP